MKFSWDESKREQIIREHGVDFEKLSDVFDDPFAIDYDDFGHSQIEVRYGIIGKTMQYGLIVLIYMIEEAGTFRFITARKAEKWMIKDYERQRRRY